MIIKVPDSTADGMSEVSSESSYSPSSKVSMQPHDSGMNLSTAATSSGSLASELKLSYKVCIVNERDHDDLKPTRREGL
jgi:hypothetical protein